MNKDSLIERSVDMKYNVFATAPNDRSGQIIFSGSRLECLEYANMHQTDTDWYDLHVCDSNGIITDHIIDAPHCRKKNRSR